MHRRFRKLGKHETAEKLKSVLADIFLDCHYIVLERLSRLILAETAKVLLKRDQYQNKADAVRHQINAKVHNGSNSRFSPVSLHTALH